MSRALLQVGNWLQARNTIIQIQHRDGEYLVDVGPAGADGPRVETVRGGSLALAIREALFQYDTALLHERNERRRP